MSKFTLKFKFGLRNTDLSTYRNKFSAPSRSRSSRSICRFRADRARCNLVRQVAAFGSVPYNNNTQM